uniref:Uncharacterized protein n=1 Tax=Kalanchoe fedtschenkoi TaxID=63787 RepID=A0A7N0RBH8_KALFE
MASSSKLPNGLITRRLFSVAKHERAGDATAARNLKIALDFASDRVDVSKWRKVNSTAYGIDRSIIPLPSRIVLKVLRDKGHQCFLVGGCVRDLLLKRVPKDFDVITTANLKQIKNHFHRSHIVGRRFPVCVVHIRGHDIEVSSFDTVASMGFAERENSVPRLMPKSCSKTDMLLWRNSMHRDFTINSLFFDPYYSRIYDYSGGMTDLKSLQLRTLVPAHLSFQEDCARILRGVRIAARLSLSVSHETAAAIYHLSSSVFTLSKSRIMMELNYMLSYGAAQPSLSLLERFDLLKVFFPFHAAILDQQTSEGCSLSSTMLMKLFSNLDNMVACGRPGHCSLWISLLAFHQALNTKPQKPLVIWAFSSLLCFKKWSKSVEFARECAQRQLFSAPEISKSLEYMDDVELANKVLELASLVATSIDTLTRENALIESFSRFRRPPTSAMIFISEKCGRDTAKLFSMFDADIKSYTTGRKRVDIDYESLRKGEVLETRYVLGQVIMDTMSGKVNEVCSAHSQEITYEQATCKEEVVDDDLHIWPSVNSAEKAANETKKFSEKPFDKLEEVAMKHCNISEPDLDVDFLEELGPPKFQEKTEELLIRTCLKDKIREQKVSEIVCHETERLSKQNACNSFRKIGAEKIVNQKMFKANQVMETLNLQTEIKFSYDDLKKDTQPISETFQWRQETLGQEKRRSIKETNNRKPLSSLFKTKTMEHDSSRKVAETADDNLHQQLYDQDQLATNEPTTSENFRKDMDDNSLEAFKRVRCPSTDKEPLKVGRTCQTKTTGKQNLSGKLQHETESLLLGGNHYEAVRKQKVTVILSQVIKEKAHAGKNCAFEVHTNEVMETSNSFHQPASSHVPEQNIVTKKRKIVKTKSESQEKTKTGLVINSETSELNVDADIQEAIGDTRCQNSEEVAKERKTDQIKATVKQNLSENLEPGPRCRKGRRGKQTSENMVNSSDNKEEACGNIKESKEATECNIDRPPVDQIQQRKPSIKKRESSKTLYEPKNEMKIEAEVKKSEDSEQNADILEALQKSNEDLMRAAETGVTKTASKQKKRRKDSQKQESLGKLREEINETCHNEKTDADTAENGKLAETVSDSLGLPLSDQVQDKITIADKKKKSRKILSKTKDEMNAQPASSNTAMQPPP